MQSLYSIYSTLLNSCNVKHVFLPVIFALCILLHSFCSNHSVLCIMCIIYLHFEFFILLHAYIDAYHTFWCISFVIVLYTSFLVYVYLSSYIVFYNLFSVSHFMHLTLLITFLQTSHSMHHLIPTLFFTTGSIQSVF